MNTPWLRLYTEILNDPKLARLTDEQFRTYIRLLCAVKLHDRKGQLPSDEDTAFMLRLSLAAWRKSRDALIRIGLIDITETTQGKALSIHGWSRRQYESDHSNERVDRYRKRHKAVTCNAQSPLHVTPPEQSRTETEQNRTDNPPTPLQGGNTPPDSDDRIAALADAYPTTAGKQQGIRAICEIVSAAANPDAALAGLERHWPAWCAFLADRDAQYRPRLDRFVRSNDWMHPPPESNGRGEKRATPAPDQPRSPVVAGPCAADLGMTVDEFELFLMKGGKTA